MLDSLQGLRTHKRLRYRAGAVYPRQKGLTMIIDRRTYEEWKDEPILHDEDEWYGEYSTYGETWNGEGYIVVDNE